MTSDAIPDKKADGATAGRDDWRVERLDLDAYLARVSYDGDRAPSLCTLIDLHRAHVAAVPFENLDIVLGRGVDPDLGAVQDKIVGRRRGGYCFEMNVLFAAALDRLGFRIERHIARIGDPAVKVAPRSHLVLIVTIGGRRWLADVGFGSGLLEPMPLQQDTVVRQGDWAYRVLTGPGGEWRLQGLRGQTWQTAYTITPDTAYPVDVEVANHYTATHPRSPFVHTPVVVRKDDATVRSLHGRHSTVVFADATERSSDIEDDEIGGVLADLGVCLDKPDVAALATILPGPPPTATTSPETT